MVDQQLAEACRLQAEQTELGPALSLLQKRGPLGATLVAVAQALGISQSQLEEPVEPTNVSHARALAHRLAEIRVQYRQQGMEPAIYFAPPPGARQSQPKPPAPVADRSALLKPSSPAVVRVAAPKPPPAPEVRDSRPPKPRINLNVTFAIERDNTGQIVVSNVRLFGLDAANYEIIAQAQDETSSADGILRTLGVIVEIERR